MQDIFDWLAARVPSFLRFGLNWLFDLARAVYNRIVDYLRALGLPFFRLWFAIHAFRWALHGVLLAIGAKLHAIIRIIIPQGLEWLRRTVMDWAARLVTTVRNGLANSIDLLRRWAAKAIDGILDFIRKLQAWMARQLAEIWVPLRFVVGRVTDLLTRPERLVEWIIAPLVRRLLRYLAEHLDPIVRWVLRSSPAFTLWFARTISAVLTRVL